MANAKRTLLMAAVLIVGTLVLSTNAWSALFLTFSGTQAAPGTAVIVQTGGRNALSNVPASETLRLFLAPKGVAATIMSANDSRLILVGRLHIDAQGNGFLRFIVPEIPVGDYTTFVHCPACATSSASAELLATGPFPGSFVVLGKEDGSSLAPFLVAAAVALGIAIGWTLRRRTRTSRWPRRRPKQT